MYQVNYINYFFIVFREIIWALQQESSKTMSNKKTTNLIGAGGQVRGEGYNNGKDHQAEALLVKSKMTWRPHHGYSNR